MGLWGGGSRAWVQSKPIVLQLSGMTQRNWWKLGLLCASGWTIWEMELKSPVLLYSGVSVFTAIQIQPPLSNHCPSFLSFSLYHPPFIYLALHLSICLRPIDHGPGHKAQQPVKAEGFELLSSDEASVSVETRRNKSKWIWGVGGWRGGERGSGGESWALVAMVTSWDIQLGICHF